MILKTKDQKHIKMNDIKNYGTIEKKPQDNQFKSFIEKIESSEEDKITLLQI